MSVVADILKSWVRPRQVVRRHVAAGPREDRALIFLMLGCVIVFLSQVPRIVRSDWLGSEVPFQAQIGGAALAWLFIAPLALYGVALVVHLIARLLGGKGSSFTTRLSLFWALFAASPLWLFDGLVAGYLGPQASGTLLLGLVGLAAFFYIWAAGMFEVHRRKEAGS